MATRAKAADSDRRSIPKGNISSGYDIHCFGIFLILINQEMKRSQKLREKIRQLQNQITGQGQQAVASLSIDQRRNPEPENLVSTTTEVIPTRQIRRPSNTNSDVSSTAEDNRNLPIHSLVPGIFNPPSQQQPVSQRIAHEPKKRSEPKPKMAKAWSIIIDK